MRISTVFKSGNSAALRLRKDLGLDPGTQVEIFPDGDGFRLRPIREQIDTRHFAGKLPYFRPGERRDLELRNLDWNGRLLER